MPMPKIKVDEKAFRNMSCEALLAFERAFRLAGYHKMADALRQIALEKGCIIPTSPA